MSKEYIDREALLEKLHQNSITDKITFSDGKSIFETVKEFPVSDVIEVVRCKYCEYYDTNGHMPEFGWCYYCRRVKTDEDFCSDGERKEGADNA